LYDLWVNLQKTREFFNNTKINHQSCQINIHFIVNFVVKTLAIVS